MPVVGKSFYTLCKKCDTDRYHTVLALPTETSAKLKCEVCGSAKTWRVPKAIDPNKPKAGPRGAALKAKDRAKATRDAAHLAQYEEMQKELEDEPELPYSMKTAFQKDTKVKHPTFGLGFIRVAHPEKIEVVFPDEVRSLVHNRR
jgi:hypothetical protein